MKKLLVRISDCVHYKGYRYGGFENHIYEDYVVGLDRGQDVYSLRKQFVRRVLSTRGGDIGTTLNISLERKYTPWIYPWSIGCLRNSRRFDSFTAEDNPDIICHVSPFGILASSINREFFWLERAYSSIKKEYNPDKFGYVTLMPFQCGSVVRYLVFDGNHRVAALHALGETHFMAMVMPVGMRVKAFARFWPGVLFNLFTLNDAHCIFDRYFISENLPLSEDAFQNIVFDENLNFGDY